MKKAAARRKKKKRKGKKDEKEGLGGKKKKKKKKGTSHPCLSVLLTHLIWLDEVNLTVTGHSLITTAALPQVVKYTKYIVSLQKVVLAFVIIIT